MEARSGDGVRLNIRAEGVADAPAILFINSIGCDHTMWDLQAAALADRFRVIRYDARGHGASGAPAGEYQVAQLGADALAVLDSVGVTRAHVCGLSLGGLTAQWLAIHAPERVERLVLANTAARIGSSQAWIDRIGLIRKGGMEGLADLALGRFFSQAFRAANPDIVSAFRRVLARTSGEGYAGCCAALRDADLRHEIGRIAAPTMVIAGALDVSTPVDQGKELVMAVGDGRFVVLNAAHLSNIEQPAAFTAALRQHLEPA